VLQARSSLTAGRTARETPCADIREQLATLGGALRHTNVRRHLRDCPGCRSFHQQMRIQRRRLRVLLPVAPTLGLKRAVLGALSASPGAGAAATGGVLSGGGLAVTALMAVAVAGSGVTAGATSGAGGHERTRAVPAVTATTQEAAATRTVHGRARSGRAAFAQTDRRPRANRRDGTGAETDGPRAQGGPRADDRGRAPGDTILEAERSGPHGPGTSARAPEPASSLGEASERGRPERTADRSQRAPRRPAGPPSAGGQRKPAKPTRANGAQAPAEPPKPAGNAKAADPDGHAQPPSGPPPGAAPQPQPSPPANPNAGGSANGNGGDNGNSGASGAS